MGSCVKAIDCVTGAGGGGGGVDLKGRVGSTHCKRKSLRRVYSSSSSRLTGNSGGRRPSWYHACIREAFQGPGVAIEKLEAKNHRIESTYHGSALWGRDSTTSKEVSESVSEVQGD